MRLVPTELWPRFGKRCLVLLAASLFAAFPLSAHVLVADGQIGAVLHMDPDDDPLAGSPTTFYFDFKDTSKRLDPAAGEGSFSIIQNGSVLYTQALFPAGTKGLAVAQVYTFPATGAYTVRVAGAPTDNMAFQPFSLSFDIRVSRYAPGFDTAGAVEDGAAPGEADDEHTTHYVIVSLVAIATAAIVTGGFFLGFKRKRKNK